MDRFDAATGASLTSIPAPAGVVITDVAVDAQDKVVAVGDVDDGGDPNVWVGRYGATGSVEWSDSFGNPYNPGAGLDDDTGRGVAVDEAGANFVAGMLDNTPPERKVVVRKYDASGTPTLAWQNEFLDTSGPVVADMDLASNGVHVVGEVFGPQGSGFALRANKSTGQGLGSNDANVSRAAESSLVGPPVEVDEGRDSSP